MSGESIYARTLRELVAAGLLDPAASTLVVAGGPYDREELLAAGFSNVTISNLDTRLVPDAFAPFAYAHLDAERLDVPDGSFDQVIEHMGLHHCAVPHQALAEMMRVARRGVLVMENRDSALMRLAVRLGWAAEYELAAVAGNAFQHGGWRNTAVPNFVYRWTEREVRKTLAAIGPDRRWPIRWFYHARMPERLMHTRGGIGKGMAATVGFALALLSRIAPKQCNVFAFHVDAAGAQPQPWLTDGTLRQAENKPSDALERDELWQEQGETGPR